jgi:hypothetical protein
MNSKFVENLFIRARAVFIKMFYLNIFKTMKGPGLKPCGTPH